MTAAAAEPTSTRRSVLVGMAWLVAATVLAYANTFAVPFLLDDRFAITDNPALGDFSRWSSIFFPPSATTAGRPVLNLSFSLNHAWSGHEVWSYHVVNLAVHACAGLLLFGIIRRTRCPIPSHARPRSASVVVAATIAAIWMLHPVHCNAVTYLSQRAESMMGMFYLLTIYCFVRATTAAAPARWYGLSIAACILGMGTKEVMITAPVLVLVYDGVFVSGSLVASLRLRPRYYAGLAASWLFLGFLMIGSRLWERGVGYAAGENALAYATTQLKSVLTYARLVAWPHPLVLDYGPEFALAGTAAVAACALLVALALAAVVLLWMHARPLGFLAGAFFLLLAPTSSVIPVASQPMAESRAYLPSAALVLLGAAGLARLRPSRNLTTLAAIPAALCALTFARNADHHSAIAIWQDALAKQPRNSRAHYNLAVAYQARSGGEEKARLHFEAALHLKPDFAGAHAALGALLANQPESQARALAHLEEALRLKPAYAEAHNNLAALLASVPGRLPEALAHFAEALRLNPAYADAHANFGTTLAGIPGRLPEAIDHLQTATRLQPRSARAHFNLANALAAIPGRTADAASHYETSLSLDPTLGAAHYNLANLLARLPDRLADAIRHYESAMRLDPANPAIQNNLAIAYANAGRLADAIARLEAVLRLDPNFPAARNNLDELRKPSNK